MQTDLKLTYFDAPGRAEVARLCFTIGGVKFTDERLTKEQFQQLKTEGKFKFDQIPVLTVNGTQYAQSGAIDRYAAKLSGLYPSDPLEVLKVEQVMHSTDEIKQKFISSTKIQGEEQQEQARKEICQEFLPLWCKRLENLINENSTGFVSRNSITLGDIELFTLVQIFNSGIIKELPENFISSFKALQNHFKLINENKKVQEWYNSQKK